MWHTYFSLCLSRHICRQFLEKLEKFLYFGLLFFPPKTILLMFIQGFFIDESETKGRRYCLICHLFKPERAHHCSVCNRCVLNMDHHCPWLNNCIGFYNRKFFILLLFYALVLKIELLVFYFPLWLNYSTQIAVSLFLNPRQD